MPVNYGIFFHMPEAEYRAIPALNATGIKHMRASPYDFWARSPHNPNLADVLEEEGPSSEALTLGKAFDVRIISGPLEFERQYCEEFQGGADQLKTCDDMKAVCKEMGLPVSGSKDVLTVRLTDAGVPTERFYDIQKSLHAARHADKVFLSPKWLARIELAAAMIEKDPVLSHAFTGGMPQVTIVWHCEKIGVDCKARLDYFKPKAIVDLKTVQNVRGLPLAQCVNREIVNRRYHVQAAFYLEAAEQVRQFLATGLSDEGPPQNNAFLNGLLANHPKTFLWVFQIKGPAPAAIGRTLPAESTLLAVAQAEIEAAKQTYRECLEHYEPGMPWLTPTEIEPFDDQEVPSWMWT